MKRKITLGLSLLATALLTGCIAVPKTEIAFNPKTNQLRIASPKNVTIGGISVVQSSNNFSLSVTNYSSTNDNAVVSAVATAQGEVARNSLDTINKLSELGKALAAKAP